MPPRHLTTLRVLAPYAAARHGVRGCVRSLDAKLPAQRWLGGSRA